MSTSSLQPDPTTIRRALARRESYVLIERQEEPIETESLAGWVGVDHDVRHVTNTERYVKQRFKQGLYRIVSVKRRLHIPADGAEAVIDLAVPRSKPVYELEQWRGQPTVHKQAVWSRLPFPVDWRARHGKVWNEWILKHGPLEDCDQAMAYLRKHARQGSYRMITVKRHIVIESIDGQTRKWSGHCMFPDDGRNPVYEPMVVK